MPPYVHTFTPRFLEIDSQGVLFNMWYLAYVDDAADGYFTHIGRPYREWVEQGYDAHVAHVELDWRGSVAYRDDVEVLVSTARVGGKSFALDAAFRRRGEITCTATIVYVLFATDGSGTVDIPPQLREALGEPRPLGDQEAR